MELQPQVHVVLDVLYSSNSRSFLLGLVFITKQLAISRSRRKFIASLNQILFLVNLFMYLANSLGHLTSTNRCYDLTKAGLFRIWSNYINSLCFKLLFIFLLSGTIFLDYSIQTQDNYSSFPNSSSPPWGNNTSLCILLRRVFRPPWNRTWNISLSVSSSSFRRYCYDSY